MSDFHAASYALSVTWLASRMSAISCVSFTMRHPAVTGVPNTTFTAGRWIAPSTYWKRTVSSTPIVAVDIPRALNPLAISS